MERQWPLYVLPSCLSVNLFLLGITEYNATVTSNPLGYGGNSVLEYPVGSNVTLTCMVTPTPPSDSEFSWSCSTGCFVDMEIEQSVNISELEGTDSGELNCSVIIDDVEYTSGTIDLQVTGKTINTLNFTHWI